MKIFPESRTSLHYFCFVYIKMSKIRRDLHACLEEKSDSNSVSILVT